MKEKFLTNPGGKREDVNGVFPRKIRGTVMENIKIGIIGHGANKFTKSAEEKAKLFIKTIFTYPNYKGKLTLVSGHSPVGGIDIWAEEIANELGIPTDIKTPKQHIWNSEYGYRQRNLDIAKSSDVIAIILVNKLPPNYKGMTFSKCYHCNSNTHIKSGACWTGKQALKLGKKVHWYIIEND